MVVVGLLLLSWQLAWCWRRRESFMTALQSRHLQAGPERQQGAADSTGRRNTLTTA